MSGEKHYLAWRDSSGLRRIEVFMDQGAALRAYEHAENECSMLNGDPHPVDMEVCLFGSDSLATLCRTHTSWFAPETLDTQAMLADIANEVEARESAELDASGAAGETLTPEKAHRRLLEREERLQAERNIRGSVGMQAPRNEP